MKEIGYVGDVFACGSVAFPKQHREFAERLSWSDIGIGHTVAPYAYSDGHYLPIDEYQYNDKESPLGRTLSSTRTARASFRPSSRTKISDGGSGFARPW